MKKIFLMLIMAISAITMNAQTAVQTGKFFDNTYAGIFGGVYTPLDFNSMFPLNGAVGLKVGKEFTPVVGIELEGQMFFNENNVTKWTNKFVKGTSVGVNGTVNLTNLIWGYNGTPRLLEVKTNTGVGVLYKLRKVNSSNQYGMTAKTALDFNLNLGNAKQHTITVTPGVWWGVTDNESKFKFNKHRAQIGLLVGYSYHFKTSNGTHHFKTYDIGAMNDEINELRRTLTNCENRKPEVVEKVVIKEVSATNTESKTWVVTFNTASSELSTESKYILNQIGENAIVDVTATASPDGSAEFNQKLSENRARTVADFLKERGVKVNSFKGNGVDAERGRSAVVKTIN